ncbi:hypothetical protein B0T14DRAFT_570695 [Immersiella caudata]|uniref:Uncharacterized protein n=1 Tax=Immersiella caudata TaxID=314043 RepID=A0AA39TH42_9PEZI|nr:hypothetical protein B0T14DRAFT_570695 [Immersiella caudata]
MRFFFLFRLLRQEWIFTLLTTILLLLTALQANGSVLTKDLPLVSHSRSYSIFFLRVISELAGLSLAATLAVTLEQAKWAIVAMAGGDELTEESRSKRLIEFLALDVGTTIPGLFQLLVSPSVSTFRARMWSLGRLITMVVVPVTGVLVMSKVEVYPVFVSVKDSVSGFGAHGMNVSAASEYAGFTDIILGSKFGSFVQSTSRSIELTPEDIRSKSCGLNAVKDQNPLHCDREYFIPGEAIFTMPEALMDPDNPEADILLAENHRGHNLRYGVGDPSVSFDLAKDCVLHYGRYWGFNIGGFLLCIANTSLNTVQAKLIKCPEVLALSQTCQTNTTWQTEDSWTLAMSSHFRTATVAYSRINATVMSYQFTPPLTPVPAPISAQDMMKVYANLLNDTTTWNRPPNTTAPLAPFSASSLVTVLYLTLPYFNMENAKNPMVASNMFATFQSILALPLYYSQSGMMRRLIPARFGGNFVKTGVDHFLSPLPERTTTVRLAYQEFKTVAEKGTLIAYVAIGGAAILFCIGVQVVLWWVMLARGVGGRLDLTSFGAVDLFRFCVMESMEVVARKGDGAGVFGEWMGGFGVNRRGEVEEGRLEAQEGGRGSGNRDGLWGSEVALVEVSPISSCSEVSQFSMRGSAGKSQEPLSQPQSAHYWGIAI